MKTIVFAVMLAAGCNVTYSPDKPISLDLQGQPETLVDFAQEASDIWAAHGVMFTIAPDLRGELSVRIGEMGSHTLGQYTSGGPHSGDIFISAAAITGPSGQCTLAHELGHAIGLKHDSENGSLMSADLTTCGDDDFCCWGALDAAELCHAGGTCEGGSK